MTLSEKELKDLLKVPTTREQALRILERNVRLLRVLLSLKKERPDYDCVIGNGAVGCPHCRVPCSTCAWRFHPEKICERAEFGGISLDDFQRREFEGVRIVYWGTSESISVHPQCPDFEVALEACIRFVRGHIEWAEAIINVH